jgi:hypothetical protein
MVYLSGNIQTLLFSYFSANVGGLKGRKDHGYVRTF